MSLCFQADKKAAPRIKQKARMRCSRCQTTAPRSTRNEYLTRTNGRYKDDDDVDDDDVDDDEVDVITMKRMEKRLVQDYGCDNETIVILIRYGVTSLHDFFMLQHVKIDTKFKGCTDLQKQKIKHIFAQFYRDELTETHDAEEIEEMVSKVLERM